MIESCLLYSVAVHFELGYFISKKRRDMSLLTIFVAARTVGGAERHVVSCSDWGINKVSGKSTFDFSQHPEEGKKKRYLKEREDESGMQSHTQYYVSQQLCKSPP